MSTVRPISEKQLEANRRNASQSTGPTTEAGKQASRMNAVTHGLLAKAVVITAGDYQEDEQEFAQLLEDLREQFTPVGVAEDLEVQKIALCYWRKMRAVRYEHGAIRQRTGDMREREKCRHEQHLDSALEFGANLEGSACGIRYLIDELEWVKQEALDGTVSTESRAWLEQHFPDEFTGLDKALHEIRLAQQPAAGPSVAEAARRQWVAKIDEHLRRLSGLWEQVAATEELNLDSKLRAAALPGPEAVNKLTRYESSNDRELDRVLKRLERMQERRHATGGSTRRPDARVPHRRDHDSRGRLRRGKGAIGPHRHQRDRPWPALSRDCSVIADPAGIKGQALVRERRHGVLRNEAKL